MPNIYRRLLLKTLSVLPLLASTSARAAIATPRQTEGPFYPLPEMRFDDQDNDLVRVSSEVREAGGDIVRLTGKVLDADGAPIAGARVEIWQVDMNGRYLHSGDRNSAPRDAAFQGFGFAVTDADGAYTFRTIKPVPYPGRTPHIHVKVLVGGDERLTTQFYIDGHEDNARDGLWRRMSEDERNAVAMRFAASGELEEAAVDIRL